jgi:hypothetical protein
MEQTMNTKFYILPEKEVGALAQAIALQQGQIFLQKDEKSSFYIAEVKDDIELPENLSILEMQQSPTRREEVDAAGELLNDIAKSDDPKTVDLMLRLKFDQELDQERLPVIYDEISKAIDSAMRNINQ